MNYQLWKIDAPHKRFHHATELAKEAKKLVNPTERAEQLKRIIKEAEQQDIRVIIGLLETMGNQKIRMRKFETKT